MMDHLYTDLIGNEHHKEEAYHKKFNDICKANNDLRANFESLAANAEEHFLKMQTIKTMINKISTIMYRKDGSTVKLLDTPPASSPDTSPVESSSHSPLDPPSGVIHQEPQQCSIVNPDEALEVVRTSQMEHVENLLSLSGSFVSAENGIERGGGPIVETYEIRLSSSPPVAGVTTNYNCKPNQLVEHVTGDVQIHDQSLNFTSSSTMVIIGRNGTTVSQSVLNMIKWKGHSDCTRKLMEALFTRETMASHSLTGKPSPAFNGRPVKEKLNPTIIEDIISFVVSECKVPVSVVRTAITTKCADENKMWRMRNQKKSLPK